MRQRPVEDANVVRANAERLSRRAHGGVDELPPLGRAAVDDVGDCTGSFLEAAREGQVQMEGDTYSAPPCRPAPGSKRPGPGSNIDMPSRSLAGGNISIR